MKSQNLFFYLLLPISSIAVFFALYEASTLFLWIFSAIFLFALVDPWMQWLDQKAGVSPFVSALILILVATGFMVGIGFLVYSSFTSIGTQLVSYKEAILHFYENMAGTLSQFTHTSSNISATTDTPAAAVDPNMIPQALGNRVVTGMSSVMNVLTFVTLTPLLTFFMISERKIFGAVGVRYFGADSKKVLKKVTDAISAFFVGNIVLMGISIPIFIIAFRILNVKSYVSLGILSGVFNLIPFLGFIMAALLPALDLILNEGHWGRALVLVGLCFITHFFVANVITPKIIGSKVELNATSSTIALIAWGHLWGPLGLLLAIPITATLKILFQYSGVPLFEAVASLMGESVAL